MERPADKVRYHIHRPTYVLMYYSFTTINIDPIIKAYCMVVLPSIKSICKQNKNRDT